MAAQAIWESYPPGRGGLRNRAPQGAQCRVCRHTLRTASNREPQRTVQLDEATRILSTNSEGGALAVVPRACYQTGTRQAGQHCDCDWPDGNGRSISLPSKALASRHRGQSCVTTPSAAIDNAYAPNSSSRRQTARSPGLTPGHSRAVCCHNGRHVKQSRQMGNPSWDPPATVTHDPRAAGVSSLEGHTGKA